MSTYSDNTTYRLFFMLQTPSTLFLSECLVGFYGVNCVENCSMTCGVPGNCDRITGYCDGGCQRNWTGFMCEEGKRSINYKKGSYINILEQDRRALFCR